MSPEAPTIREDRREKREREDLRYHVEKVVKSTQLYKKKDKLGYNITKSFWVWYLVRSPRTRTDVYSYWTLRIFV